MLEEIAKFIDAENIEYLLFVSLTGKHAVRVRDLDADENVGIRVYPTAVAARTAYDDMVADVRRRAA